jgi:1-piperideine-2-carboxylate/1-pyrroline-2-carboxylate reductase [NAD(P)H]
VKGSSAARAQAFCATHAGVTPLPDDAIPDAVDVVIAATTSKTPVYTLAPKPGRLVIGVGAFTPEMTEIAAATVLASDVFVDDPAGARHEAGDLIQAGIDWNTVQPLAGALRGDARIGRPVVFKSVGCAAWDLAACRVVRDMLGAA